MTRQDVERRIPLLQSILTSIQEVWDDMVRLRTEIEMLKRKANKDLQEVCRLKDLLMEFDVVVKRGDGYLLEINELGGHILGYSPITAAFPLWSRIGTMEFRHNTPIHIKRDGPNQLCCYSLKEGIEIKVVDEVLV
jgi:hypothetical protein